MKKTALSSLMVLLALFTYMALRPTLAIADECTWEGYGTDGSEWCRIRETACDVQCQESSGDDPCGFHCVEGSSDCACWYVPD
jgi:hypothetical protein